MSTAFLDQFESSDAAQSDEVAQRIEAGEGPAQVAAALRLSPVGVVAAIARVALGPDGAAGLPLVHGEATRPGLANWLANEATLADLFPRSGRPDRLALAAGLLQMLDSWEASHTAAQGADDLGEVTTSAAWHMIAHRREPDASNARYWARRVNPRLAFEALAQVAAPLLQADPTWASCLVDGRGGWNPAAFIEICGQSRPRSPEDSLARRLQRLEMLVLLGKSTALWS